MNMDYHMIAASILTGVASIGAVSIFLGKWVPKGAAIVALAQKAVTTNADLIEALKDKTITSEEIKTLEKDAAEINAAWNVIWAK